MVECHKFLILSFFLCEQGIVMYNWNLSLNIHKKTPGLEFQILIDGYSTFVWIFFYRETNSFRKHWARRFISWPTRPDGALSLFGHVTVSRVSFHACPCFGWEVEKKRVPCLLHLLCGITRWCTRRSDEQFVVFSAALRRRFKLGTQKKLAAVFWVWSAETSWSDLTRHTVWGVSICKYWHI